MTQLSQPPAHSDEAPRGFSARVSLGRLFKPVPLEFLLIASTALLLTIFGLVMVLSASSANSTAQSGGPMGVVLRQGAFALIGVPLMFLLSRFTPKMLQKLAWPAMIVSIALQLLVFVPGIGVSSGGNRNWIAVAGQTLQPSELMKLSLALWIAYVLMRKQSRLNTWHQAFIPVVPVSALAIGAVIGGEDLGTSIVLVLIVLACLFFSGVKLRMFILPFLLGAVVLAFYAITNPNRLGRIQMLFGDECDYFRECFQPTHGIWGLASGGIFGVGLGHSTEKHGWLDAAANDYIFAIIGEELGLIGCLVVLGLFVIYAIGAFHIVRRTQDPFIRVAAGGITIWIIGQALINIGMVLRVFPVIGVPLPFMSQGGTALISVLLASGVLLAFARTLPEAPPREATARGRSKAAKKAGA